MLCASLDGKWVWGRMDTCTYMAESLCCSPETTTTSLIGYAPYKMFLVFKNIKRKTIDCEKTRHIKSPTRNIFFVLLKKYIYGIIRSHVICITLKFEKLG